MQESESIFHNPQDVRLSTEDARQGWRLLTKDEAAGADARLAGHRLQFYLAQTNSWLPATMSDPVRYSFLTFRTTAPLPAEARRTFSSAQSGDPQLTVTRDSDGASLMPNDPAKPGIGGAPTRATILPLDGAERKKFPIASGFFDYFPDAIAVVSNLSWRANEQHNPGQPLHWARGKSSDHADTMLRHFSQRGTLDSDGIRHSAKVVWRALAMLQVELEAERERAVS